MDHKNKLIELRNDFQREKISKTDFLINAALHYLELKLWNRAKSLICQINRTDCNNDNLLKLLLCEKKLNNYAKNASPCNSLNMIVKNEEKNIGAALDSIDSTMDEIIICDTGSNDKTIDIAMLYGIKLVEYPWNNSFCNARNAAIKASTGKTILWLDADDRLSSEDSEKIRKLSQKDTKSGYYFKILNTQKNGTTFDFSQLRLFPRLAGVKFEQNIHEQVCYSLQRRGIKFKKRSDIQITHTGYEDNALHRKKAKRNFELVEKELRNNRDNLSLLMSLGDSLSLLGKELEAFKIYKEIMDKEENKKTNLDIFVQAHLNCADYMIKHKVERYAVPLLEKSIELDPTRTESMLHLGKIAKKSGNHLAAEELFHRAASTTPPIRLTATPTQKIKLEAIYALTDLYIERGKYEEAAILMTAALKDYPHVPAFYNLSGKIFKMKQHYREAARFYSTSLQICPQNNSEANLGMAEIYSALGDTMTSKEYLSACA